VFAGSDPELEFIRFRGAGLSVARFRSHAAAVAARLPQWPGAVNLCERRENFLVAFAALLARGQACLLPPTRVPAVVDEVLAEYPGAGRVDDEFVAAALVAATGDGLRDAGIAHDRVVVVGYTSGSTGRPRGHSKTWGALAASTALNAAALRDALPRELRERQPWLVATVPPQHMYGLEMSVLLPLLGGFGVHGSHPLYPADIASALADVPEPRVLVSTPVHLRALLQSRVPLPALQVIVSATAPLSTDLATALERHTGAVLLEFFGSTETCVIASRRTAAGAAWRPYAGVELKPMNDGTTVNAPWFVAPVVLQDVLDVGPDATFTVRGRNADMVEVAGKRASLADLTRRLLAVPGVHDAVVFQPDDASDGGVYRLAALAVAPGLDEAQLLSGLAAVVDPVFLPRPLRLVPSLPRNDVGKLPRESLLAALRR
jgi:acyl-coenzyme A synthetase/AMP-(fatty) acid ligase